MSPPGVICDHLARIGCLTLATRLAHEYRVSLPNLLGQSRMPNAVRARHRLWAIMRDTLALSYPEVASCFGADHTTVMVGIKKRHRELDGQLDRRGL
jgi:chromosomal replication initiation ATPase DnaA